MALWIKDAFLDVIGFGAEESSPAPTSHGKRKACEDGRLRSKSQRYSNEAYRSAPYGTPSPSSSVHSRRESRAQDTHTDKERQHLPHRSSIGEKFNRVSKAVQYDGSASSYGWKIPDGFVDDDDEDDDIEPLVSTSSPLKYESVHPHKHAHGPNPSLREIRYPSLPPKVIIASQLVPQEPLAQDNTSLKKKPSTKQDPWTQSPYRRALEIASFTDANPAQTIQREIGEPEYALRDIEIRDTIWRLQESMEAFSKDYFGFSTTPATLSPQFFSQFSAETAKVVGCVASGGPGGVQGWYDMFIDVQKRRALVMAMMGNVLVEQVFQHMFFGGIAKHIRDVTELQVTHGNEDGFDRNARYATHIRTILDTDGTGSFSLPGNFSNHVNYVIGVIYTHLAPIASLSSTEATLMVPALYSIVTRAGILSLSMRIDPHTVYHFEPVFKEDTFSSKRMKCFNRKQMDQTNLRTSDDHEGLTDQEKKRRAGMSAAEKQRARYDDPLTQITVMDGVTAYRRGGWESAGSTVLNVKYEKREFRDKGIRGRVLTPGLVYCRWGRARQFKDGRSADVPAAHGVAWSEGFREFSEVEGVVDWADIKRKEKGEKRRVILAAVKGRARATVRRRPEAEPTSSAKGT